MTSFVTMTLRLFVLGSCWQLIQNADALVKVTYPKSPGRPLEVYGHKISADAKPVTSWKTPEHYLVFRNDVDLLVADEVDGKGFIVEKGDSHMVVTLGSQQVILDQVGAWTESLNDRIRARDWVKFAAVAGDTDTIAMISRGVTFYCKKRRDVNIRNGATPVTSWKMPDQYFVIRNEVDISFGWNSRQGYINEIGDSYMVVSLGDQHVVLDRVGASTGELKQVFNTSDLVEFTAEAGDIDTMTMTCNGVMFYCKERENVYIESHSTQDSRLRSIRLSGTDANSGDVYTRPRVYFVIRGGVDCCGGGGGRGLHGFVREVTDNYIVVSLYNGQEVILDIMGEWGALGTSDIKVGNLTRFTRVPALFNTISVHIENGSNYASRYYCEEPNSEVAKTALPYKAIA